MAHDVFLSYSSKDKPIVDSVCGTLEGKRIRCWVAPRDVLPGLPYAEAIVEAIESSRLMVLIFSASANNSPQVMREVERAVSKGIPIIPLRIEQVPPSKSLEYFISAPQWLDALTPPLEKHLQSLAETVQLLLVRQGERRKIPEVETSSVLGTVELIKVPENAPALESDGRHCPVCHRYIGVTATSWGAFRGPTSGSRPICPHCDTPLVYMDTGLLGLVTLGVNMLALLVSAAMGVLYAVFIRQSPEALLVFFVSWFAIWMGIFVYFIRYLRHHKRLTVTKR
jgi:hypothetical protein